MTNMCDGSAWYFRIKFYCRQFLKLSFTQQPHCQAATTHCKGNSAF